jgi:chorismate dehydratase
LPVTAPRIGSVGYLNAAPLTRGIEAQVLYDTPAALAQRLRAAQLDAALVSITEVLFNDAYELLEGWGIISHGEVKSVLLAHRVPLAEVREVHCHTASLTSVNLLKVLLGRRGLRPVFRPLERLEAAPEQEAVLLIGDPALDFLFQPGRHQIWDLGAAWRELTGLPFVYAAWALRRGAHSAELRDLLHQAGARGLAELEALCRERTEYDLAFRRSYLGGNIRYELGPEARRGLQRFAEEMRGQGLGPVTVPRFVR